MIQPTRRHWCLAVLGAVLFHGAVAAALLWQAPRVGASGAGAGGIEVSLAPAGGAPGGAPGGASDGVEEDLVEEAEEPLEAKPQEVERLPEAEPVPPETIEAAVAEAEEAPPSAEPLDAPRETAEGVIPLETPVEPRLPEAEMAEVAEPESAPLPPLPEARPRDLPHGSAEEAQPQPEEPALEDPGPQATQTAGLPPAAAGSLGSADSADGAAAGAGAGSATGGGDPGEVADYLARLQAWLERHKEYPRHARQRRQEGTVMLYFVMDREGRVLDYRVTESSGYDLLDRAVEEMIQRAQPLPGMPAVMTQARLELRVPVQFYLR